MMQTTTDMEAAGTLRVRLRRETGEPHRRLDRLLSELDLGTPSGLGTFLLVLWRTFAALEQVAPEAARSAPVLRDLRKRAGADLAVLGIDAETQVEPAGFRPAPLALDYIVAGSRLGTVILKRQWASTGDLRVAAAQSYFASPDHMDLWREFCADAAAIPADGAPADEIVADAARLFALFTAHAAEAMARGFRK